VEAEAQHNSIGTVYPIRFPERAERHQVDEPGRDRDQLRGQHEQRPHVRVDPAVEQVMLPDEEAQQGHADHARRGRPVAEQRFSAEHRNDLRHHPKPRQRQDVHLGVPEEPEHVLVQVAAAAELVHEEGGLRGPVHQQHVHAADEHRREHHQLPGDHGPEARQPAPAHAGRT
jgi:hypothetical protein